MPQPSSAPAPAPPSYRGGRAHRDQATTIAAKKVNFIAGHALRDRLHRLAAAYSHRSGVDVTVSEIIRRVFAQLSDEDIQRAVRVGGHRL